MRMFLNLIQNGKQDRQKWWKKGNRMGAYYRGSKGSTQQEIKADAEIHSQTLDRAHSYGRRGGQMDTEGSGALQGDQKNSKI